MEGERNIFLEAALKGTPVITNPKEYDEMKLKRSSSSEARNKRKESSTRSAKETAPNSSKMFELAIVKEAIHNVGQLPSRVLRYVQLMANKLGPIDEAYYTSVGKTGCPTREAARRRILRRMKETGELKDEKSCTTASNSDSKL
ncbi:uncharacterized protein LOC116309094, partial [Actinia tenebrosa]|uniref:Uncharacterized protein LOC116309094 n=1 Tax=Actinia tenebrosa TaxID=6105 RepID=A0A6P8J6S3_ACTTE